MSLFPAVMRLYFHKNSKNSFDLSYKLMFICCKTIFKKKNANNNSLTVTLTFKTINSCSKVIYLQTLVFLSKLNSTGVLLVLIKFNPKYSCSGCNVCFRTEQIPLTTFASSFQRKGYSCRGDTLSRMLWPSLSIGD